MILRIYKTKFPSIFFEGTLRINSVRFIQTSLYLIHSECQLSFLQDLPHYKDIVNPRLTGQEPVCVICPKEPLNRSDPTIENLAPLTASKESEDPLV